MAFTASPETQTYGTDRIPLIYDLDIYPGDSDFSNPYSGLVNLIPFSHHSHEGKINFTGGLSNELYADTRDPINATSTVYQNTSSTLPVVRGMYVWEKSIGTIYYFTVVSDAGVSKVYTNTSTGGSWTAVTTISDAITPVRFTEFIDGTNTKKLIMVDGTHGWVFTDNTAGTQITDVNFPTPHVPFPVFLDGYLFLAKAGTGDIYNSNLNDPTTWTSGSFLSAEMYPDDIQALVRINNYIVAIGTQSGEYFYDAGNSPGTPLAKYDGAVLPFGTVFPNSIAATHNRVVMLANNLDGQTVFKIIEDFQSQDIPASSVLKVFEKQLLTSVATYGPANVRGMFFRQNDELVYIFNFQDGTNLTGPSSEPTVAYSFSAKCWFLLRTGGFCLPIYFTAPATSKKIVTHCVGTNSFTGGSAVFFGYFDPTGTEDTLPSRTYVISQSIYTPPQNFGTLNRKFLNRLAVGYTTNSSENGTTTPIYLQWSDNQGVSFSSSVQLAGPAGGSSSTDGGFPFINQLGSFRQRSFILSANSTSARYRFWFMEISLNKGIR